MNLHNYLKKVWYKISPVARNLRYIFDQNTHNLEQINGVNNQLHLLSKELESNSTVVNEIKNYITSADFINKMSNIENDIVCHLQNHLIEFSFENKKKIYNTLKFYETQFLEDFVIERIVYDDLINQINNIIFRYKREVIILTDIANILTQYKHCDFNEIVKYKQEVDKYIFVLVYKFDWNALNAIEILEDNNLKYVPIVQTFPMARYFHINKNAYDTLISERENQPRGHYCPVDFENIFQCLEAVRDLDGDYVEIGTYQGASARAALNYMKRAGIKKKAYFLDTYEGFTYEDAENSTDAHWNGTHTETSEQMVKDYLSMYDNGIVLKNNICSDELPNEIKEIALCNIDVDIYDAVYAALYKVYERIVPNGIIICEDYGHTPLLAGAQYAVKKFLDECPNIFTQFYFPSGQLILIKNKK